MKKMIPFIVLFSFLLNVNSGFAASGIFQSYIIIDLDGGGNAYYAGGQNADGATAYTAISLGTPTSLVLNGGENKTWKNSGSNVTGAEINYRVYEQGTAAPGFTAINLPFDSNLGGGGDQKWSEAAAGVDILGMATSNGTWVLEVYWKVTSSDGDHFDSNGGANFTNTFVVTSLPVELIDFSTKREGSIINLAWQTATEINNSHFLIEKSSTGSTFEIIAELAGAGNSFETNNYDFLDKNPLDGINYYRLTDVSFDGEENHSKVISINFSGSKEVNLSPNPVNDFVNLKFDSNTEGFGRIEIFNSTGQLLITNELYFEKGNNRIELQLADLPKGAYFLRIRNVVERFLKN